LFVCKYCGAQTSAITHTRARATPEPKLATPGRNKARFRYPAAMLHGALMWPRRVQQQTYRVTASLRHTMDTDPCAITYWLGSAATANTPTRAVRYLTLIQFLCFAEKSLILGGLKSPTIFCITNLLYAYAGCSRCYARFFFFAGNYMTSANTITCDAALARTVLCLSFNNSSSNLTPCHMLQSMLRS
jgi:hypothetical protein